MYNLSDIVLDTTFIKTAQHMHSQVSVKIHCNWQKKYATTKEKMEGQTSMKTEESWVAYILYLMMMMMMMIY